MLQRLIYFSERAGDCGPIDDLVARAAARNRARGLTGMLVAEAHAFVQVLEGGRGLVSALFQQICRDPRHGSVTLVEVSEIARPSYPDWGMAQIEEVAKIAMHWRRISPDGVFHPPSMSARQIWPRSRKWPRSPCTGGAFRRTACFIPPR